MSFEEKTYSILLVSASEKFTSSLQDLFPQYKYFPIKIETSISSAKRALLDRNYDFIIINSPLTDEDGVRFAIDICSRSNCVVLIFVRSELYNSVCDKVSKHGVYVLSKPTSLAIINTALDWMVTTRERFRKFEKKTLSLEDKMQEIRIVNRAKWLLITELKLSEADAHHYIEKQAMDRCVSKKEIAEEIINTYS